MKDKTKKAPFEVPLQTLERVPILTKKEILS
jgi:hypothetical protein